MFGQIKEHFVYLEKELSLDVREGGSWKKLYKYHLSQLRIFNTERLIHLIIMLFVGLYTIILFGMAMQFDNVFLIIVALMCLVLFVCYVFYYFKLENIIQKIAALSPIFLEKIDEEEMMEVQQQVPGEIVLPPVLNLVADKALDLFTKFMDRKNKK
ncbi:MAG: hypothetical protein LBG64_03575 [Pseudomonadales bacterium]|jgi:hypothetical protein|nr:hypothetical protein [Pseudomonadales bacterium]